MLRFLLWWPNCYGKWLYTKKIKFCLVPGEPKNAKKIEKICWKKLKIVKKRLKIGHFKWSLGAELCLYKWSSYKGSRASKIVHLIAQIVPIQKIDPYIYISSVDNTVQTFSSLVRKVWTNTKVNTNTKFKIRIITKCI